MLISPNTAFHFLTRKFAHIERFGNIKTMRDFLASRKYRDHNAVLLPSHIVIVSKALARAMAAVDQKQPLPLFSKRGWRSWTPERIAKLKAADAKHGNDEGIARELGISLKAAKAARHRHIGKRDTRMFRPHTTPLEQAA